MSYQGTAVDPGQQSQDFHRLMFLGQQSNGFVNFALHGGIDDEELRFYDLDCMRNFLAAV